MDRNQSLSSLVQERIDRGTLSLPVFDRTALTMRQMIDRGHARAAEFTWLRAARQLRQVYQQLTTQA